MQRSLTTFPMGPSSFSSFSTTRLFRGFNPWGQSPSSAPGIHNVLSFLGNAQANGSGGTSDVAMRSFSFLTALAFIGKVFLGLAVIVFFLCLLVTFFRWLLDTGPSAGGERHPRFSTSPLPRRRHIPGSDWRFGFDFGEPTTTQTVIVNNNNPNSPPSPENNRDWSPLQPGGNGLNPSLFPSSVRRAHQRRNE
ncbi:hypothetical protein [Candidatus Similichlamydia laticola]|uniref:hypothetical protein n=1 Tax=Candidatus Similichlamydia laticola TaxID=2170265 RepID=UPI000DF7B413|nr:hypothetical protein [Candidatus Similichlamydia laticola]